jgi:hypothetical protein
VKLTGSGFGRAEACPASAFLPHVDEPPGVYAVSGSAVHRYLCLVAEVGRDAALALMEVEHRDACAAIDLDTMPHAEPANWAVEVAFAWDWLADTARELHRGSGSRDYSGIGPSEVAGTADLIGLDGGAVVVLDLKTGWADLGNPADSPQLQFYALAAALAYGATEAVVGFIHVRDGVALYDVARLDAFALAAAAERLRGIVVSTSAAEEQWAQTHQVTPVAGEHCRYCPAFLRCPAKATLARELALQSAANDPTELTPVLDAASVPAALERLWAAQQVLERVKRTLDEFAASHPVYLPDGRVYGSVESSKESFDPAIGASALAQLFGPDVAGEAVEVEKTLSKAALERALRKHIAGTDKKLTHAVREAHEAIRAAGGSKVVTWTSVKAFKPKLLK